MNHLAEVINQINAGILAGECLSKVHAHGLTELITKDGKTFPVEVKTIDACDIVPDDRKPLQVYHRLNDLGYEVSPLSVGRDEMKLFTASISLFAIGTKDFLKPSCNLKSNDLANVISSLVIKRPAAIDGIMQLRVRQTAMSANHNNILSEEFAGFDFKKLNLIRIMAIKIEYQITGHICGVVC